MFITNAESLLSWGGSFLTVDLYKKYLNPKQSERHFQIISFFSMLLLSVCGVVIAFNLNSLQALLKIVFSISAGVAPVYILRWFWYRINAWSQLSAMISSGVYTLLFPYFFNGNSVIYGFAFEEARLIIVTVLTTFTWLMVTFLTKKDDNYKNEGIESMYKDSLINFNQKVFNEDKEICEKVQIGIKKSHYDGQLSEEEMRVCEFQRSYTKYFNL
jgi:Na+/proline symporter